MLAILIWYPASKEIVKNPHSSCPHTVTTYEYQHGENLTFLN